MRLVGHRTSRDTTTSFSPALRRLAAAGPAALEMKSVHEALPSQTTGVCLTAAGREESKLGVHVVRTPQYSPGEAVNDSERLLLSLERVL